MFNPDEFILNHVAQYHTICRDYLHAMSIEHSEHIKTFVKRLELMKECNWIKPETAEISIEIIQSIKGMYKDGKKNIACLH